MSITTVTSKGQITIPKDIRPSLGLGDGDKVLFVLEAERAILVPLPKGDRLSDLHGVLRATRPDPGQAAIRDEIQRDLGERISRGGE